MNYQDRLNIVAILSDSEFDPMRLPSPDDIVSIHSVWNGEVIWIKLRDGGRVALDITAQPNLVKTLVPLASAS